MTYKRALLIYLLVSAVLASASSKKASKRGSKKNHVVDEDPEVITVSERFMKIPNQDPKPVRNAFAFLDDEQDTRPTEKRSSKEHISVERPSWILKSKTVATLTAQASLSREEGMLLEELSVLPDMPLGVNVDEFRSYVARIRSGAHPELNLDDVKKIIIALNISNKQCDGIFFLKDMQQVLRLYKNKPHYRKLSLISTHFQPLVFDHPHLVIDLKALEEFARDEFRSDITDDAVMAFKSHLLPVDAKSPSTEASPAEGSDESDKEESDEEEVSVKHAPTPSKRRPDGSVAQENTDDQPARPLKAAASFATPAPETAAPVPKAAEDKATTPSKKPRATVYPEGEEVSIAEILSKLKREAGKKGYIQVALNELSRYPDQSKKFRFTLASFYRFFETEMKCKSDSVYPANDSDALRTVRMYLVFANANINNWRGEIPASYSPLLAEAISLANPGRTSSIVDLLVLTYQRANYTGEDFRINLGEIFDGVIGAKSATEFIEQFLTMASPRHSISFPTTSRPPLATPSLRSAADLYVPNGVGRTVQTPLECVQRLKSLPSFPWSMVDELLAYPDQNAQIRFQAHSFKRFLDQRHPTYDVDEIAKLYLILEHTSFNNWSGDLSSSHIALAPEAVNLILKSSSLTEEAVALNKRQLEVFELVMNVFESLDYDGAPFLLNIGHLNSELATTNDEDGRIEIVKGLLASLNMSIRVPTTLEDSLMDGPEPIIKMEVSLSTESPEDSEEAVDSDSEEPTTKIDEKAAYRSNRLHTEEPSSKRTSKVEKKTEPKQVESTKKASPVKQETVVDPKQREEPKNKASTETKQSKKEATVSKTENAPADDDSAQAPPLAGINWSATPNATLISHDASTLQPPTNTRNSRIMYFSKVDDRLSAATAEQVPAQPSEKSKLKSFKLGENASKRPNAYTVWDLKEKVRGLWSQSDGATKSIWSVVLASLTDLPDQVAVHFDKVSMENFMGKYVGVTAENLTASQIRSYTDMVHVYFALHSARPGQWRGKILSAHLKIATIPDVALLLKEDQVFQLIDFSRRLLLDSDYDGPAFLIDLDKLRTELDESRISISQQTAAAESKIIDFFSRCVGRSIQSARAPVRPAQRTFYQFPGENMSLGVRTYKAREWIEKLKGRSSTSDRQVWEIFGHVLNDFPNVNIQIDTEAFQEYYDSQMEAPMGSQSIASSQKDKVRKIVKQYLIFMNARGNKTWNGVVFSNSLTEAIEVAEMANDTYMAILYKEMQAILLRSHYRGPVFAINLDKFKQSVLAAHSITLTQVKSVSTLSATIQDFLTRSTTGLEVSRQAEQARLGHVENRGTADERGSSENTVLRHIALLERQDSSFAALVISQLRDYFGSQNTQVNFNFEELTSYVMTEANLKSVDRLNKAQRAAAISAIEKYLISANIEDHFWRLNLESDQIDVAIAIAETRRATDAVRILNLIKNVIDNIQGGEMEGESYQLNLGELDADLRGVKGDESRTSLIKTFVLRARLAKT